MSNLTQVSRFRKKNPFSRRYSWMNATVLTPPDAGYPVRLRERLCEHAPSTLIALGNLALLSQPKTALFCSARCPGDAILSAYDTA